MKADKYDIAIIGGGIVGLATALAAGKRGKKVALFEKNTAATGASIRNFGMIWPIGQERGANLETAILSRAIWMELAAKAKFWLRPNGSLHLAYHPLEKKVIQEFIETSDDALYNIEWLDQTKTLEIGKGINPSSLLGALYSKTECLVNPREALTAIASYIEEAFEVDFFYETFIHSLEDGKLISEDETWEAEHIFVCSGADFKYLYPSEYEDLPLKVCKLQMLKTSAQPANWKLGPSLCGGLTLRHYKAFENCSSLLELDKHFDSIDKKFKDYGIHVMVSQNNHGELIIGDSHEYGEDIQPFDKEEIYSLILKYLQSYFQPGKLSISERWHGIYAKSTHGYPFVFEEIERSVFAVNGFGGAGMTLSFGAMEQLFNKFKF
jgi:FAD dependent oxidoreductase TIGR03364